MLAKPIITYSEALETYYETNAHFTVHKIAYLINIAV